MAADRGVQRGPVTARQIVDSFSVAVEYAGCRLRASQTSVVHAVALSNRFEGAIAIRDRRVGPTCFVPPTTPRSGNQQAGSERTTDAV